MGKNAPYTLDLRTSGVKQMRTNIDIDDELMEKAMAATGLRTKKSVVEEALKLLLRLKGQERIKEYRGKLTSWEGSIDEMRRDRLTDRE
jgi:Arc/MetJ family transcription regulator